MSVWLKIAKGETVQSESSKTNNELEPLKATNESELEECILRPELKKSIFEPDDNYPSLMSNNSANKPKIIKKNKKDNKKDNKDNKNDKDDTTDKDIDNFKQDKINAIDEIIKTHCANKASEISKQIYNMYQLINPIEANKLADDEYNNTYNKLYVLLSNKYKNVTDNIINTIDNISFDNISVVKSTKSSVTKSVSESSNSLIVKSLTEERTESVIIRSGDVSEDEEVITEVITEVVTEEYNNSNNSNNFNNFNKNNKNKQVNKNNTDNTIVTEEFNGWTKVINNKSEKLDKSDKSEKYDKSESSDKINPLKKFANDLASKLIKDGNDIKNNNNLKNNNPIIFQIKINCKNQILGYIDNKKIFPNKFLDPTYINTTEQIHSPSHRLFKREFFEVLNNRIGENHNIHARFDKDYDDSNIFYIRFFKRRNQENANENNNWIS